MLHDTKAIFRQQSGALVLRIPIPGHEAISYPLRNHTTAATVNYDSRIIKLTSTGVISRNCPLKQPGNRCRLHYSDESARQSLRFLRQRNSVCAARLFSLPAHSQRTAVRFISQSNRHLCPSPSQHPHLLYPKGHI
jgi:hypothetical protein